MHDSNDENSVWINQVNQEVWKAIHANLTRTDLLMNYPVSFREGQHAFNGFCKCFSERCCALR